MSRRRAREVTGVKGALANVGPRGTHQRPQYSTATLSADAAAFTAPPAAALIVEDADTTQHDTRHTKNAAI